MSLQLLKQYIEGGIKQGLFVVENSLITSQMIWCSVYGALLRICVEDLDFEQGKNYMKEMLKGIRIQLQGEK